MLEHGGRLRRAAQAYGIALEHWLDLSTGINPMPYPVPDLPPAVWQRLPEDDDGLEAAAAAYYGTDQLMAVAGSQAAIQQLPALIPGERVTIPATTYAEHPHAWREHHPTMIAATEEAVDAHIERTDILVLVNPNNPTGVRYPRARLLEWHGRLAVRGGWLLVDEAFIDAEPADSLATEAGREGLVILRSTGKFFGLAGARTGFVLAPRILRTALAERLGPWAVSGPGRYASTAALSDHAWQAETRTRLAAASERLAMLLRTCGIGPSRGTALFQWVEHAHAAELQHRLAMLGILVRRFDQPASLRFGLPPDEAAWRRLEAALATITAREPC